MQNIAIDKKPLTVQDGEYLLWHAVTRLAEKIEKLAQAIK